MILRKGTLKKKSSGFWNAFHHAFGVGDVGEPDADDLAALQRLAEFIVKRRMESPAILFLQSMVPLSYIGSQVMAGLEPFIGPFYPRGDFEKLQRMFERRDGINRLTTMIEELISERDTNGNE